MSQPLDQNQQKALNAILCDAVGRRNLSRVVSSLEHGADAGCSAEGTDMFDHPYTKPLGHYALENYDADVMNALVKGGLPLEKKDRTGNTVLAQAVKDGKRAAVEHLLKLGANPLSSNNLNETILEQARKAAGASNDTDSPRQRIIDLLLDALPRAKNAFNDKAGAQKDASASVNEDVVVRKKPLHISPKPQTGGKPEGGFSL